MIDRLSGVLAKITLGLFFLYLFCAGLFIGGTALHDPDTCWIVALGRYMFEHGGIPSVEPFSYTFVDVHRPLVLYQWMTELLFYGAVKIGGLAALLVLVSTLVMTSFVVIPMKLFEMARVRWYQALPLILLVMVGACFHFLARPEIISYLFLSLLLFLLTMHRLNFRRQVASVLSAESASSTVAASTALPNHSAFSNPRPAVFDYKLVLAVAILMVAWSNFHTGFISGLIVLASYVLASLVSRLIFKVRPFCDFTALAALLLGVPSTLCNPYGVGLWQYIPSLFFAGFNHLITELHSVDIRKPEFSPFCLFLTIFLFVFFRKLKFTFNKSADSETVSREKMQIVESFMIFAVCVFEGWSHLRLIPFVVLVLMYELALLLAPVMNDAKPVSLLLDAFNSKLAAGLAPRFRLGSNVGVAFALLIGVLGTMISFRIQTPVLPQSGGAFKLPVEALEIMNAHHANEHILNDPQFGDALIWYHPDAPKVFVDTRFDMYGENLVRDYLRMQNAETGWEELIDKYGVKAVFLSPNSPLIQKLKVSAPWQLEYSDKDAAVLFRP
jgi:hypothetical protein